MKLQGQSGGLVLSCCIRSVYETGNSIHYTGNRWGKIIRLQQMNLHCDEIPQCPLLLIAIDGVLEQCFMLCFTRVSFFTPKRVSLSVASTTLKIIEANTTRPITDHLKSYILLPLSFPFINEFSSLWMTKKIWNCPTRTIDFFSLLISKRDYLPQIEILHTSLVGCGWLGGRGSALLDAPMVVKTWCPSCGQNVVDGDPSHTIGALLTIIVPGPQTFWVLTNNAQIRNFLDPWGQQKQAVNTTMTYYHLFHWYG